jgi:hypothetical protein
VFCSAFSKAEAQRLERKIGVSLLAFFAPMPSKKAAKEP